MLRSSEIFYSGSPFVPNVNHPFVPIPLPVPVSTAPIPSTDLGLRSQPVSSAMAAVFSTGPSASTARPVGLTPRQIDEQSPPLDGVNRAQK